MDARRSKTSSASRCASFVLGLQTPLPTKLNSSLPPVSTSWRPCSALPTGTPSHGYGLPRARCLIWLCLAPCHLQRLLGRLRVEPGSMSSSSSSPTFVRVPGRLGISSPARFKLVFLSVRDFDVFIFTDYDSPLPWGSWRFCL